MTEKGEMRRVGDVAPSGSDLEGEYVYVRSLIGEEFVITDIAERVGDNGEYLAVNIERDGKRGFFFTSHQAVYRKLLACKDELPLLATIVERTGKKSGRNYFDIE